MRGIAPSLDDRQDKRELRMLPRRGTIFANRPKWTANYHTQFVVSEQQLFSCVQSEFRLTGSNAAYNPGVTG
jgi:hypothetical protein